MGLESLKGSFASAAGAASQLADQASSVAGKALDEFNLALPTLRSLGFTMSDLHVGMGTLLPEISAKLIASTDTVEVKRIKELEEKNAEKKVLVVILKALEAAYNIKKELGDLPFKGVEISLTLGIPPKASIGFINSAVAGAAAAATAHADHE
jgi:hypothetical protein